MSYKNLLSGIITVGLFTGWMVFPSAS